MTVRASAVGTTSVKCRVCVDDAWPHKHYGDTQLPLLLIVRDTTTRYEYYFHGTVEQSRAFTDIPDHIDQQEKFEALLLTHKDWDKALAELRNGA